MYSYSGVFAGVTLSFCFLHEGTASFYGGDLTPCAFSENCIRIPPSECAEWQGRWGMKDPAYAEYVLSCSYACDALMRRDRIVFHGAAFRWHQRAWLFSAPSGTGKTTQLKNWQRLFGGEMEIMNGDKPILELCADGHVLVRPYPWKGKEGLGRDDITAPLGGIILLRQDRENRIARATPARLPEAFSGAIIPALPTRRTCSTPPGSWRGSCASPRYGFCGTWATRTPPASPIGRCAGRAFE